MQLAAKASADLNVILRYWAFTLVRNGNIIAMIKKLLKPIMVVVIFIISVWCSLWLKSYADLSEISFMGLITISSIYSILLPNLNKLKSFSLARGEVILQEVKDSEAAVKELALATLNLVEASNDGSIVAEDFDQGRYNQSVERIKSLTSKA
ncbi:hypothetical protein [Marinobacterium aestuarii]|uniref:hypothetical protein n=1 Tax=Marinobacterium aestuarii TaxID=1821621 RepID=UPI0012FF8042|nr:hypothetical protein [Marinobacterium aestuarii]